MASGLGRDGGVELGLGFRTRLLLRPCFSAAWRHSVESWAQRWPTWNCEALSCSEFHEKSRRPWLDPSPCKSLCSGRSLSFLNSLFSRISLVLKQGNSISPTFAGPGTCRLEIHPALKLLVQELTRAHGAAELPSSPLTHNTCKILVSAVNTSLTKGAHWSRRRGDFPLYLQSLIMNECNKRLAMALTPGHTSTLHSAKE